MQFLSIQKIASSILFSLKAYTIPIILATVGAVLTIINIESGFLDLNENGAIKLIYCFYWGALLFLGIRLFEVRKYFTLPVRIFTTLAGFALIGLIYFSTNENIETFPLKLATYSLAVIFFLSISFYINVKNEDGFWQINKIFFLRILLTLLFCGVIFAGIMIAIVALKELFSIDFNFEIEPDVAVIVFGLVSLFIFIGGLPRNLKEIDDYHDYPKLLKIAGQFIFLPLTLIYFIIIYAFYIKIIIEWNLPKGFISLMILIYAVTAFFTYLLIYPSRKETDSKWINLFKYAMFAGFIPLTFLIWLSISERFYQYGITTPRYFVVAMALWLLFISLYFLFYKQATLKAVPISLIMLIMLISIGPWSAYNVAEKSQASRLINYIKAKKLMGNNTNKKLENDITTKYKLKIKLIDFEKTYGANALESSLKKTLNLKRSAGINDIYSFFGIEYYNDEYRKDYIKNSNYINFYLKDYPGNFEVSGYDLFFESINRTNEFIKEDKKLDIVQSDGKIIFTYNYWQEIVIDVKTKFLKLKRDKSNKVELSKENMIFEGESENLKVRLYIESAYLNEKRNSIDDDENLNGKILIKFKKQ